MLTPYERIYQHHHACDGISSLPLLEDASIDCFLSDIPYGIGMDDWDVLHKNTNSALLGQSPAQIGKSGFKRRGNPIRGWSSADRNIPREYQDWCTSWASLLYPKMKPGASLFLSCRGVACNGFSPHPLAPSPTKGRRGMIGSPHPLAPSPIKGRRGMIGSPHP